MGILKTNTDVFANVTQVNLTRNVNSWNQHANVIYVESPCGVGFSYGTNLPSDYETNDNITAVDNYMFLQGFFDVRTLLITSTCSFNVLML